MIAEEQERWCSIAQLAAEYETIAAVAQRDRWVKLIENCGLTGEQVDSVLVSDSFGPLTAELRRAEAQHHDVRRLLPALVAQRSLDDAEDVGAVLISRLRKAAQPRHGSRRVEPKLIAGLIPVADGPMRPEMETALFERETLMEARALRLAAQAVESEAVWLERLGSTPTPDAKRRRWLHEVRTVAAYRDRYRVGGRSALGDPRAEAQKLDAARAAQAIRRALAIATEAAETQDGPAHGLLATGPVIA